MCHVCGFTPELNLTSNPFFALLLCCLQVMALCRRRRAWCPTSHESGCIGCWLLVVWALPCGSAVVCWCWPAKPTQVDAQSAQCHCLQCGIGLRSPVWLCYVASGYVGVCCITREHTFSRVVCSSFVQLKLRVYYLLGCTPCSTTTSWCL